MSLRSVGKLLAHMHWADDQVLGALREAPGDRAPRALELYAHVLGAEAVWLARLEQRRATVAVWPALSLDEAGELAAENRSSFETFLASLGDNELVREIAYVNSAGQSFRSTIEDILLHVALHGCYHRGQVALLVRDGGGIPAPTDFIGFVRGVPAATRVSR